MIHGNQLIIRNINDNIIDTIKKMETKKQDFVPIIENNKLLGIFSDKIIRQILIKNKSTEKTFDQIRIFLKIPGDVKFVKTEDTIEKTLELIKKDCKCVICTNNGRSTGTVDGIIRKEELTKIGEKFMLTTLKIEYEKEDAIKYEMLKTFLSLCGVFVYEGDHDNNIKKFCICRDKDIDKIFIQLKQELDLNTEESNYFDWLWNLYFQSNQSKEIFLSLFLNNYNSDILSKINVNITRLEILCKEIHNYESDCYSKVYSEMKLLYIIGLYIKEQNADISEILNNISILYKTFDKYANYKSVFSELICAIYMNLVEDYPLAMIFYRNCNLDINYKAHFRVAKYYRLTHNYYKLYTINQKILDCNPYSFKAKYDFALDNEYNGNTAKALNIYQSIIDELILKQDFLNPFEFQILCFSLGQSSKYQEDDIIKSENYDKIFNLLNSLNRNKFISFFVEKDTLIEYYKDRVSEYINSTDQLKKHIEEKENLCEKESKNMFEKKWNR